MDRSDVIMSIGGYLQQLRSSLPEGAELYLFDPHGVVHVVSRGSLRSFDPVRRVSDQGDFLSFIDADGKFARYFVGSASTSEQNPSNATHKLGVVNSHNAFTPHAHGVEHFVLSLGYASCGLYDRQAEQVVHVRLFPGTLLYIPPMIPHSFRNRSADPLLLVVTNTGMGIDHDDYAITAEKAEQRALHESALAHHGNAPPGPERPPDPVDYDELAAVLRRFEREMPDAAGRTMTWREQVAGKLRKLAWMLESQ